jgi:hypothetical protein
VKGAEHRCYALLNKPVEVRGTMGLEGSQASCRRSELFWGKFQASLRDAMVSLFIHGGMNSTATFGTSLRDLIGIVNGTGNIKGW